jgi:hypothetical protein
MPRVTHAKMRSRWVRVACAAATLSVVSCTSMQTLTCRSGEQRSVQDTLFFGADKPDGVVTPDDWSRFLDETVTPRFPQGLSVWQAAGQWRSESGRIVHEASRILDLVHPDDETSERAVLEIAATYKTRFHQEAVLRVRTPTCVSL